MLDAYGAAPEHWPDQERDAARRLIEQSDAARALWQRAANTDRLLDAVEPEPPAPILIARVLAAAPRRRPGRVWRRAIAAAVPLAAAAAVTLWFAINREPTRHPTELTVVQVGEFTSPTDVLLDAFAIDASATVPSVGCSDSVLGCPQVETPADGSYSQLQRRSYT
ncbi:MAG TPA: hypothetical protein VL403_09395 [Candidatus Kryptonia bacterium]|nr:hypothetical protein [Candidatus Kryptonia bacterium]